MSCVSPPFLPSWKLADGLHPTDRTIAQARQEHPQLSARRLCALLGVGRSWYYERLTNPIQTERDVALRDAIERIVLEFPGYGYRRVTKALVREGWVVNHKRVLRVM